jgi:hypothetical protein
VRMGGGLNRAKTVNKFRLWYEQYGQLEFCYKLIGYSIENRVLRRICGTKRDEVTGGWRKLHDEEHHNCTLLQV